MKANSERFHELEKTHWRYYIELEEEMLATRKYVDFDIDNFTTFSLEYLKLLQAVCGEIDILGKTIAKEINPDYKPEDRDNSIYKWWFIVQDWYESLPVKKATFCRVLEVEPWQSFRVEQYYDKKGAKRHRVENEKINRLPQWWKAYTDIKHKRTLKDKNGKMNYNRANLGNLIYAFTALYILEKGILEQLGNKDMVANLERSEIFNPMKASVIKVGDTVYGL